MTEVHYPRSLRQSLAYLDVNPLVCMVSKYAATMCRSHWWYVGFQAGVIWFEPYPVGLARAHTGMDIKNTELEVGLEFDAKGFAYSRGPLTIRVDYVNTLESLK
jgi:hypothetical protein